MLFAMLLVHTYIVFCFVLLFLLCVYSTYVQLYDVEYVIVDVVFCCSHVQTCMCAIASYVFVMLYMLLLLLCVFNSMILCIWFMLFFFSLCAYTCLCCIHTM